MTGELLTLPRPSNVVRCRPSMQVDGSSSSAYIAAEQHASDWLTVNLAVNSLSNQCKDAPRWCLTAPPGAVTAGTRRPLYLSIAHGMGPIAVRERRVNE